MQRLTLYVLATLLFLGSFWLGFWPCAFVAVALLAAYGYGYSAALMAFVVEALWGHSVGFFYYLGMPLLVLVAGIILLRAVLIPQLRSRVPSAI